MRENQSPLRSLVDSMFESSEVSQTTRWCHHCNENIPAVKVVFQNGETMLVLDHDKVA